MSPFRSALRITLIYIVFGSLWIAFSDMALESMVDDVATLSQMQTYKGWFYVLLTGLLFFLLSLASLKYQQSLSERDPLTKLLNRHMFKREFETTLQIARKNKEAAILLLINLDGFRLVNNAAGQQVGDSILRQTADLLRTTFEVNESLSRLASDEFAVTLRGATQCTDIVATVEQFQKRISMLCIPGGTGVGLTARVGIACHPEDGESVKALLTAANLALEEAKLAGPGQFRIYNRDFGEVASSRLKLIADLKEAIHDENFSVVYQPQFDARSKRITGVEVLIRWLNTDTGPVRPDVFVPLAEQLGLVSKITDFVCRTAVAELKEHGLLGEAVPRLSINVSARDLEGDEAAHRFFERFAFIEGDLSRIQLEITETAVMDNLDNVLKVLERLRKRGVQIAVDDFGTGYSSLSMLRRLPVQEIKIDRSFIRDVSDDPNDAMIVRTILAMASALELHVVAEGVETTDQALFLKEHGCDELQGFLMSPPLPIKELVSFVAKHQASLKR
ncbi:MAG: bifunctional diguanylate cyclase/phosphodiesterase [Idiomarina sp.]|nr:bifunctional diguanylate cyclase/phosphodiesterase [Idiomarina sp.]